MTYLLFQVEALRSRQNQGKEEVATGSPRNLPVVDSSGERWSVQAVLVLGSQEATIPHQLHSSTLTEQERPLSFHSEAEVKAMESCIF